MSHHLGLNSIKKTGSTALTGDVTLSEGSGVTLTQSGNDIAIAASGGGEGGATSLADLTDVDVSGVDSGDVLVYSSEGAWYPEPKPAGVVSSVVAGTGISVNNADPANPIVTSTGGVDSLNDVGDVNITTPITTDKYLRYDASGEGFWANMALQVEDDASPTLGGDLDLNGHSLGNADAADLTKLSNVTATATELNHVAGATSSIQTQLDAKVDAADVIDEDDFSSNSDTKVPTQQSVKAYVDANAGGGGGGGAAFQDERFYSYSPKADEAWYVLGSVGPTLSNARGLQIQHASSLADSHITMVQPGGLNDTGLWNRKLCGRIVYDYIPTLSDVDMYVRFGNGSNTTSFTVVRSMGFRVVGADNKMYAFNCNGSAETKTDISSYITTGANLTHDLVAIHTPATDVKFYVNGTLVATHTTNIASGDTNSAQQRWFCFFSKGISSTARVNLGLVQFKDTTI